MVEQEPAHLDIVFHALSDRTRRAMLRSLSSGAQSVGDLAAPFAMSLAGASKHVKVLENAGLVVVSEHCRIHADILGLIALTGCRRGGDRQSQMERGRFRG